MKLSNQNRAFIAPASVTSFDKNQICLPKKETFNQDQRNNCAIVCRLSVYFVRITLAIFAVFNSKFNKVYDYLILNYARLSHLIITQSFTSSSLSANMYICLILEKGTLQQKRLCKKWMPFLWSPN